MHTRVSARQESIAAWVSMHSPGAAACAMAMTRAVCGPATTTRPVAGLRTTVSTCEWSIAVRTHGAGGIFGARHSAMGTCVSNCSQLSSVNARWRLTQNWIASDTCILTGWSHTAHASAPRLPCFGRIGTVNASHQQKRRLDSTRLVLAM